MLEAKDNSDRSDGEAGLAGGQDTHVDQASLAPAILEQDGDPYRVPDELARAH